MNAKRSLSLLLAILMCLSMIGSFTFGTVASAATASTELSDDMIFADLGWTPANVPENITVGGKTYELIWGVNAYGDVQKAVDAAPEFGTIYLGAGGYTNAITITKSLTILGAKYGIDPNVKGATEKDLWTLNPARGHNETVLEASINLGVKGDTIHDDSVVITIDGLMVTGQGQFCSNTGKAGTATLNFKNIYLKDSLHTSPVFFICPYYSAATNAYQRYVTFDNLRIEGHTKSNVLKMTAEYADMSGIYMAPDCTKPLFDCTSASATSTGEVQWNLHDSMFAATIGRTLYFNWENPQSNSASLATGLSKHSKVVNNVYNNVFVNNYKIDGDSTNSTLAFRLNTENVYYNIKGNAFYQDRAPVAGHVTVSGYSGDNKKNYADQFSVENNRFYGNTLSCFTFNQTTTYVTVNGTYAEKNGTAVAPVYAYPDRVVQQWYWKDAALSVKSTDTDAGAGHTITATRSDSVTVSEDLPDRTVFVDQSWTAETLPATITVRGKTVSLIWNVNAFADFQAATTAAPDFGTVYLSAGTYAAGFETQKNLTILGPKFGINPNVKGEKENDLWTLNPERGTGEAIITGSLNLSASTSADSADYMVVDGIQVSDSGNLRSNAATIRGYANVTLKNLYLKNTKAGQTIYFHAAYPSGTNANAFRRDVTIQDMRVEGNTGTQIMTLVADRADISGVYVHTDSTKLFLPWAAASNGPTDEVLWNIHDNMFASPVGRGIYLNWENPTASDKPLYSGVAVRSKIINNLYNNVFVNFYNKNYSSNANRSVAARFNTENVYVNLIGNTFYQSNALATDHIAFQCYSGKKLDYSDQVVVKNNKFIGNFVTDFSFDQTTSKIDISGNYAVKDGATRALVASADHTAQEWYYLDEAMSLRSDDTTVLKAPTKVAYNIEALGTGKADGLVTVTLPAGHGAEELYLFWGDAKGKLTDYTGMTPIKVSGNEVTTRIKGGTFIPAEATRLLAYTYSEAKGFSTEYAAVTLPYGAAMKDLGEPLLEFQSVSDIHISTTTNTRQHHDDHLRGLLEDVMTISPNSAGIFANGDSVDRATDEDYAKIISILGEYQNGPTVYTNIGNHEFFRYGTPLPKDKTMTDYTDPYVQNLVQNLPADTEYAYEGAMSYTFKKNGYKFIFLGTDVVDQNYTELNNTTLNWLKAELAEDRDPTRPVFVLLHQNMSNTARDGISYIRPATDTALKNIFKDYPEVIMFNGHTHTSMYEPVAFHQGNADAPAVFNTSAVGYIPLSTYSKASSVVGSEGYYVSVYEDKVIVRGRDLLNGKWISGVQVVLDTSDNAFDKDASVGSPYWGKSSADLFKANGTLGGTVTAYMHDHHNADDVALFFGDADGSIIGTQPFATAPTNNSKSGVSVAVGFADVEIPENADYVLVYGHSDTLGWSADCDVVKLADFEDMSDSLANGNVSTSGKVKTDKKVYKLGEPIYVTGIMEQSGDWIGMQLASVTSGSFLNYQLSVAGSDTPVDITKQSSLSAWGKFQQVTAGYWQIGWISKDNPKQTFQTGKLAEHLITIHIIDHKAEQFGLPNLKASDKLETSMLEAVIAKAEAFLAEDYTPESFAALKDAINAAKVAKDSGDQAVIDAASITLQTAIDALVAKSATGIAITATPKTTYHIGRDTLDVSGGKITITYDNNTTKVIDMTTDMVSGFDNSAAGSVTLTVTVEGKSAEYVVTIEGHTESDQIVDTAATCSKDGVAHTECTVCEKILKTDIVIPATKEHSYTVEIAKVPATCMAEGTATMKCSGCDATQVKTLAKDADNHDGDTTIVNGFAPTCGQVGYEGDTKCACGKIIATGDDIPATGKHAWDAGKITTKPTTTKEGVKTFTCTVCGGTKVEKVAKLPAEDPKLTVNFKDVKKSDFFYTPVQWAVAQGVTTGTSKTTFGPEESCTRAQAVTFLWRAAGSPAPKSSKNPFTDVKKSDYFYKAVLWAAENGVTSGTSATKFSPNEVCTRGQIVTFLWRAQGGKKVSASNPFKDVKKSDYYYNAVLWAVKNGVTTGTSKTTFGPAENCTRGQIVTFLYRAVA